MVRGNRIDCSVRETGEHGPPVMGVGGYDLPGAEGYMAQELEIYLGFCWRWRNLPKPTIAQVQGKVIAGGLSAALWDVDKAAYTPAGLVRHIIEQATGITGNYAGTQWWRDPTGWNMAELAGPLGGGKGAMYREYWSRWLDKVRVRHPQWTQMTTLPALNFITLPSPVPGTHYGLSFVAGGRLRSDFYIDLGTPEASAAQFDALQLQQDLVESFYGAPLSWERLPDRSSFRVADYSEGDITTPFGGYRQSGFGGRDNGLEAMEQYTETKTIWITLR